MSQTTIMPTLFYPSLADVAVFDSSGPRPQFLVDSEKLKVIVAGLEAGQRIPAHAEALAIYYFLDGSGVMTVNNEEFTVHAGSTVVAPPGAERGIHATGRLTFLAVKSNAEEGAI